MSINTVCVLGGSGFIGQHLVAALSTAGKRVRVITRRPERARSLLVLPGLSLVQANIHDPAQLQRHITGADAVINLVGILNESGHDGSGFRHVHVDLVKKIITACQQQQVRRLLHMSSLHANAGRGSFYLRSKGEGENIAHTFAGRQIQVTSFRPSIVFGPGDQLFNRFAALIDHLAVLPLACPYARFAPVYVGDLVRLMVQALEQRDMDDAHVDVVGPETYSLKELLVYTAELLGKPRLIIGLPDWLAKLQAYVLECLPGQVFSRDNYASLQIDSVNPAANPQPTSIHSMVPSYIGTRAWIDPYLRFRQTARRDAG